MLIAPVFFASGLVAVGVDEALFDKVAGKLAESGDLEKVPASYGRDG